MQDKPRNFIMEQLLSPNTKEKVSDDFMPTSLPVNVFKINVEKYLAAVEKDGIKPLRQTQMKQTSRQSFNTRPNLSSTAKFGFRGKKP